MFAARPHTGPELSAFQPVTIDEVRKLLASISRKTSPLDILPVSLLKGGRDAVSDPSDFVDEELSEHADEISAFRVVMDDLLPAVQQGLCRAPCSTDVA